MADIAFNLEYKSEDREKNAFYASDYSKPLLDLYFAFQNEPKTNPPKWYDTLRWGAGKGVEDAIVSLFKSNGIIPEDYDQKQHGRISIERNGVTINGYIDAKTKDGLPIEVKSINNANKFDVKRYESGNPREGYVGQLAIYMDALGVSRGYLFVSSIDGLNRFLFEAKKYTAPDGSMRVKCANTEVNLTELYNRWGAFYKNNVLTNTPPDIFEYRYKVPVEEVDWHSISKSDISKARNNNKVIGDWQVSFSDWKDLIISMQGDTSGYTPAEIEFIKNTTKGFTNW